MIKDVVNKSESTEEAVMPNAEVSKDTDLLNKFLHSPPKAKCSDELQVSLSSFTLLIFLFQVRNFKLFFIF